ncbi:MAG: hypothetical protein JWQ93_1125 [Marmoricola sp.]|nr:hypothetical protein [Marmoricola sp.]
MSDPAHLLAAEVSTFCEQRFADVQTIAALASAPLAGETPRRGDLAIERHCVQLLTATDPPLAGAGVVVAPYVLSDDPYWLEWWLAGPDDDPAATHRLGVDLNPDSVSFRDYTSLSWFEEPQRTGARTITGPYVDYVCTDSYTLTFTAPLTSGDRFLGVAGVDVLIRWFEQHLFTVVDGGGHLDAGCVVVNRAGRVVACPGGDWVTGDLIRELAVEAGYGAEWQVTECVGTPFVAARRT